MAGYTSLVQENEELARVKRRRLKQVMESNVGEFNGKISPERSGGVANVIRVVDGAMVLPRPKPKTTPTMTRNQTGARG